MNNVLEVTGLYKSYQNFQIENLNFAIKENCITGFIGINGAGKTTTIRTILGLSPRDSGSIIVFGKDMKKNEYEIKNSVGVVLDDGGFYDDLTMAEMKSILAPAYTTWDETDYNFNMKRFSLNPGQKISTLSKGMRMKFALALALSHKADLLIMDEPTSGLDPLIRSEFMNLLLEFMKADGKSVFFSTHITSDLDKIADMLILLHNGKILLNENKDTLLDSHRLIKGDPQDLSPEIRRLLFNVHETQYGFTGITRNVGALQKSLKNILIEKPTIEDIMLGYIGGEV